MWRKTGVLTAASFLLLTGCIPGLQQDQQEEGVDTEENEQTTEEDAVEVSPEVPSLDNYYRSVLQDGEYISGAARTFHRDVMYNRMDLERMSVGMQELAAGEFSQENYFFRAGQLISSSELNSWLMRQSEDNEAGLNPPLADADNFEERERNNPRPLSNIIEHNYMVENDNGNLQLGGMVIGLSMNNLYYFRQENDDGTYGPWLSESISRQESMQAAKETASRILERLRSEDRENGALQDIPIMFTIFREAPRDAAVPGNFIATGTAAPGEGVNNWQNLNEDYVLFPSTDASDNHRSDAEAFNQFRDEVNTFFENFVGVVGEGYYQNDEWRELTVDIPITFYSETEVIAFTQHVTDKVEQHFPNLDVEVRIRSSQGQEALVVKDAGEESYTHVY
ncbi:CamS family sex pheromone protein [Salibacterium lacus]|uniref:CamS family sex pheromone protein n=1 Tax=Salibacterium lacus TaxID=1898109 RepID=A0ABW5T666_9BACI